jgi:hypothetical protein
LDVVSIEGKDADRVDLRNVLGYLNFSSGESDPKFLSGVNRLFQEASASPKGPGWIALRDLLLEGVQQLEGTSDAFRCLDQARRVIDCSFGEILPAYHDFHRDLLQHHSEETLFQSLFIGRVFEAVLAEGAYKSGDSAEASGPSRHDSPQSLVLKRLNDFLGYRPVATLENNRKAKPYSHERVAPLPLYIEGAGVASGRYQEIVDQALKILRNTPFPILEEAEFFPENLRELALDPRAYDFDHPVNRRPNHHFGAWDPDFIDLRGYYSRFVLQHVTLDGLLERVERSESQFRERRLYEAAAVLAGTMLMGSGVSGRGPDAYDSDTTLVVLMPRIAAYRDRFYDELIKVAPEQWRDDFQAEAEERRQPFGGVRQDLNQFLAQRRADQVARITLAQFFARIGYPEAAREQAEAVAVVSARMRCEIDCEITRGHQLVDKQELEEAALLLPRIEETLDRGIHCGALVDPWNILGFGAQFSLFPAIENTVHDHRVDDLIEIMNDLFTLYGRLQREAAAAGKIELQERLSDQLELRAAWWDQFASTEVSGIEGFSGEAAWRSTRMVATVLRAWHDAGTASGDVRFWSQYVGDFRSAKSYVVVIDALLEQRDPVASMALLMNWLSQSSEVPLAESDYSFHSLAVRWMADLWRDSALGSERGEDTEQCWPRTTKFLDFLEANAGDFWNVPRLEITGEEEEPEEGPKSKNPTGVDDIFLAAYENVTYKDSTDDGVDSETDDGGGEGPRFDDDDFELAHETKRISDRLAFLITLAKLWKFGSIYASDDAPNRADVCYAWLRRAATVWADLLELLDQVQAYSVPRPSGTTDSLLEYDRQRGTKEVLLDRIMWTCVEVFDAVQLIQATLDAEAPLHEMEDWEIPSAKILKAIFRGDDKVIRSLWPELLERLAQEPLLYIPTTRGGSPHKIVASRCVQQVISRLLEYVPKMGLLVETFQLLETIHLMEQSHPVGPGAITEFDRLFEIGCKGTIECLVESSSTWELEEMPGRSTSRQADHALVNCLEEAIESLLRCWLGHSQGIRISVLESVADHRSWDEMKRFIEKYGEDLFTQHFMSFGNLRAILHEGVNSFVQTLLEMDEPEVAGRLIADLRKGRVREDEAVGWLELILEAVAENYSEYLDYNSTTTQSDRGELLHMFLDFLRLQSSYDRVAWNLKPVFLTHEVMVRKRRDRAADLWQASVARRSHEVANNHIDLYRKLSQRYGIWLPSVRERLEERFIRPLEIDRLCAWVRPAIESRNDDEGRQAFRQLHERIELFLSEPSSVGFDMPSWLEALQSEEVDVRNRPQEGYEPFEPSPPLKQVVLSIQEAMGIIEKWAD